MGNLTSCTSGGFNSTAPSSPPPATLPPSTLPPVARVLLVEGGALTFTCPIKVIKLLLDYPFHVICPLDSLRPGQHSLSSLLPDEELELGQLYLLLPLKTFENRKSMPSMGPLIRRNLGINMPNLQVPLKSLEGKRQISMPNMPTRCYINNCPPINEDNDNLPYIEDSIPAKECGETAKLLSSREKSDMGFLDSDDQYNDPYVGDSKLDRFGRKLGVIARDNHPCRQSREQLDMGFLSSEHCRNCGNRSAEKFHKNLDFNARENQKNKRLTSMATFSTAANKERVKKGNDNNNNNNNNNQYRSRLCDTPELQMAYRSAMLRRCRSWTPRLESITENKRIKSAAYD